ncbi:rRNA maturation RNase YbeY [Tropicimonas sp. S265A]|uniref:rRNA maturation RNase YbeY n=1 Tax=Tropicimonas sp. S265A TaxID=3415134 RepID=UPI003C7DF3EC
MTPPDATTEIAVEDPRWASMNLPSLAPRAIGATLSALNLPPEAFEVSMLACDDARIANLNAEFRDKPVPTNVLSWPAEDRAPDVPGALPRLPEPDNPMERELGDLALAYETCMAEAQTAGISAQNHVTHLIVHGTLHLLGFDHITDADATRMEALERVILATLGIADPYSVSVLD